MDMKNIGRRRFLKLAGSAGLVLAFGNGTSRVFAQDAQGRLVVVSHDIHRTVATTGEGGDVAADWLAESGASDIEWRTAGIAPMHELLFREASLRETSIGVGFLLNRFLFPRVTGLFQPLDDYLASDPIEDFGEFFPGMVDATTIDGNLYGVPVRHSTSGLHYNEEFLEERGLSGPPQTIEEFAEYARRLTYTRDDGTQVHGFIIEGNQLTPNVTDIARAWNGDFITLDYEVVCNEPPMVKAVTLLRELFDEGVLPVGLIAISSEDIINWMQTGRAAMSVGGMGRNQIYNDPDVSQFPGRIKVSTVPISEELAGSFDSAPVKVEFWSMTIPQNSENPDLAWSFIRHLASKDATLRMALNGNGPTRASTYEREAFASRVPYAEVEQRALAVARVPLPAFDNAAQASDAINEEVQSAILGAKAPQQAMDDLARRLEALLNQ